MRRIYLILAALTLLAGTSVSVCAAGDGNDASSDPLSDYLHANRLPLVEARTMTDSNGQRSVLLYGYVATDFGKRDAEEQTRDFLDDPDIAITNRIVVRPELLTLGNSNNSGAGASSTQTTDDNEALDGPEDPTTAAAYANIPDEIGDSQDYANQERDAEIMIGNASAFGGMPFILTTFGSGAIVPPLIAPPYAFGPIFYPRFSPSVNPPFYPPIGYPGLPVIPFRPPVYAGAPRTLGTRYFPTAFPPGPPPAFPAGPPPAFPATGGMSASPSAVGHSFSGFAAHGFAPGFVGGFHGGFGGGHR